MNKKSNAHIPYKSYKPVHLLQFKLKCLTVYIKEEHYFSLFDIPIRAEIRAFAFIRPYTVNQNLTK